MIPLHDDNPTAIAPAVTVALIVACSAVWLWQFSQPPGEQERTIYALGVIPAVLLGERSLPPEAAWTPPIFTLVSSMFLHGGWMHLIGNMLYLWIFGNNVEDAMGHVRFIVFYLVCGVAAALAQTASDPASTVPMVGASGAIGGVLGAYLVLHPKARVLVLIPLGIFSRLIYVPAFLVLGLWFVLQIVSAPMAQQGGGVAYWAHIGGFAAGAALIFVFRRRGVTLLDRDRPARLPRFESRRRRGPWG
jgi:membrane associated rhomboid family serine protease